MGHTFYVYIMASRSRVLYTGVTNNIQARALEHRQGKAGWFTARYYVHRLVYYEGWGSAKTAIAREKQIKGMRRSRKIGLVESMNPQWRDLSELQRKY